MAKTHKTKFRIEDVAAALKKAGGIYTHAAHFLGKAHNTTCARNTVKGYVERNPELAEVCSEASETLADLAESQLKQSVARGDPWAVRAVLFGMPVGRARGYTFQMQHTGKDGGPIEHEHKADLSKLTFDELTAARDILLKAKPDPSPARPAAARRHRNGAGEAVAA